MRVKEDRCFRCAPADLPAVVSRAKQAVLCAALFLPAILGWGCAGVVSGHSTSPTSTPPPTYTISGTITPAAGGSGTTITSTATDLVPGQTGPLIGTNVFLYDNTSGPNHGLITLVSHSNAVGFATGANAPSTTQGATVTGANVSGVNFTATAQTGPTFSISGTISPVVGGSGATVLLSGAAGATTVANSSGSYTFANLASGTYLVTPSNSGFSFSPVNQSVTVAAANITGVNFTATAQVGHTVSLTWNASTSTVASFPRGSDRAADHGPGNSVVRRCRSARRPRTCTRSNR